MIGPKILHTGNESFTDIRYGSIFAPYLFSWKEKSREILLHLVQKIALWTVSVDSMASLISFEQLSRFSSGFGFHSRFLKPTKPFSQLINIDLVLSRLLLN